MNTDGMLTAIKSGQADSVANDYDITPKREKEFLFSPPLKYSVGSIVVRESDDSGSKSLDDFKGKKAAGEATTKYMAIAEPMTTGPWNNTLRTFTMVGLTSFQMNTMSKPLPLRMPTSSSQTSRLR